jgi:hypothetical protein
MRKWAIVWLFAGTLTGGVVGLAGSAQADVVHRDSVNTVSPRSVCLPQFSTINVPYVGASVGH